MEPNPISSWSLRAGTGDLLALAEQRRRRKDVGWTDEEKAKFFGIPKPGDEAATESAADGQPAPVKMLFAMARNSSFQASGGDLLPHGIPALRPGDQMHKHADKGHTLQRWREANRQPQPAQPLVRCLSWSRDSLGGGVGDGASGPGASKMKYFGSAADKAVAQGAADEDQEVEEGEEEDGDEGQEETEDQDEDERQEDEVMEASEEEWEEGSEEGLETLDAATGGNSGYMNEEEEDLAMAARGEAGGSLWRRRHDHREDGSDENVGTVSSAEAAEGLGGRSVSLAAKKARAEAPAGRHLAAATGKEEMVADFVLFLRCFISNLEQENPLN